jgi:hypothetical protein
MILAWIVKRNVVSAELTTGICMSEISELLGKTITEIAGLEKDSDEVRFRCSDGTEYRMLHRQDCCESVAVEDVVGDYHDLIGSPILVAEEPSSEDYPAPQVDYDESYTWTFYKLDTNKGGVTIRWLGMSNGYYSESVDFEEVK